MFWWSHDMKCRCTKKNGVHSVFSYEKLSKQVLRGPFYAHKHFCLKFFGTESQR